MKFEKTVRERRRRQMFDDRVDYAYCEIKNGIVTQGNDDPTCCLSKGGQDFVVQKAEGTTKECEVTSNKTDEGGKGMMFWINPDPNAANRTHILYAFGDKIFRHIIGQNGVCDLIYQVDANAGYEISFMNGEQRKKNLFFSVGDPNMSAKIFKYDGTSVTQQAMTQMFASRLVASIGERLLINGTGDNNDRGIYSTEDGTGNHTDFTPGTYWTDGGELSGQLGAVTAMINVGDGAFVFERNRVTFHEVTHGASNSFTGGAGTDKYQRTHTREILGVGTYSPKGVTIGEDRVFFVDKAGIYSLGMSGDGLVNLTESFRQCWKGSDFDFTDSSIAYHKSKDLLMVTASSAKGLPADRILYYNTVTQVWTYDCDKKINQLIWNDETEQMWGTSSVDGKLLRVWDGTYNNEGEPICLRARTRWFDDGDMYYKKRLWKGHLRIGRRQQTTSFKVNLYLNDECSPHVSNEVNLPAASDQCASNQGIGQATESANTNPEKKFQFMNYCIHDKVCNFCKIMMEIEECGDNNFLLMYPKFIVSSTNRPCCNTCTA